MTSATYTSKYANSWALIIGINDYKHVSPLAFAANDANAVARVLIDKFRFPAKNVLVLLDKSATAAAIRKAFHRYTNADQVKPDDRLLVFFAGHGHTTTGRRGEVGFLVPSDGNPRDLP